MKEIQYFNGSLKRLINQVFVQHLNVLCEHCVKLMSQVREAFEKNKSWSIT